MQIIALQMIEHSRERLGVLKGKFAKIQEFKKDTVDKFKKLCYQLVEAFIDSSERQEGEKYRRSALARNPPFRK